MVTVNGMIGEGLAWIYLEDVQGMWDGYLKKVSPADIRG